MATATQEVGQVWAAQIAEQDAPEPLDGQLTESVDEAAAADSASTNEASPSLDHAADSAPLLDSHGDASEDEEEPRTPRSADPREALVDVLRRRLEAVLQPVDDSGDWTGVFVIT